MVTQYCDGKGVLDLLRKHPRGLKSKEIMRLL